VNLLIMTSSQYQAFSAGGSPTSVWSSGAVASGTLQKTLGAGSYEFVFLNPSSTTPSIVQVISGIQATAV
jgi:hypothetical protein